MNGVEKGRRGEDLAAAFLLERGYRILKRNYRQKTGEIDIIAGKGKLLVFCEVKCRRSLAFGSGAEAVGRAKQLHILNTALLFLQQTGQTSRPCRFDIVEVLRPESDHPELNHIVNAFGQ